MDRYDAYFNIQGGGGYGGGGVGRVYIGFPYQRGHGGIGSFLAGIFRRVLLLFSRGATAVGKEAVRAGMNILSDMSTHNTPLKETFRNRMTESGETLKRKAEEKLDKKAHRIDMRQLQMISHKSKKHKITSTRKTKGAKNHRKRNRRES